MLLLCQNTNLEKSLGGGGINMSFFKEERIYRVEVIEMCQAINFMQSLFSEDRYLPSQESFKKGSFGYISVGTKGWVVRKFGKLYFTPDKNQEGLDLFLPAGQTDVLISYNKIKHFCRKL